MYAMVVVAFSVSVSNKNVYVKCTDGYYQYSKTVHI